MKKVEKIKEERKNTKTENLQNGQEECGGKKLAYMHIWGKNSKSFIMSSNLVWNMNGCLDKFLTSISLHLPKEALSALWKIQFTIGTNF